MEDKTFHEMLTYYVNKSHYKKKQLAQELKIERTTLQKYISGDRSPSGYDIYEQIINKLNLSKHEKDILKRTYNIEKMGYGKYEQLLLLKESIEALNPAQEVGDFRFELTYSFEQIKNHATNMEELKLLVRYVINQTLNTTSKRLRINIPIDENIFPIIISNLRAHHDLELDQILNLETNELNQTTNNNIIQFNKLIPLLYINNAYIHYSYNNYFSHLKNTFSYPYLISCDDYTLLINDTLSSGILLKDEINTYLNNEFDQQFLILEPFYQKFTTLNEMINCLNQTYRLNRNTGDFYSYGYEPCIFPVLDDDIVKRAFNGSIELRDYLIAYLSDYRKQYHELLKNDNGLTFYFTKSGLQSFYDTGLVSEIPSEFYRPFTKQEVILLLQRIINLSNTYSKYKFYIINEEQFNFPQRCCIGVNACGYASMTMGGKNFDSTVEIAILEPTITFNFTVLHELLDLDNYIFDSSYSLNYLQNFINEKKC